jgi:CDP-paratose 2-epimerase
MPKVLICGGEGFLGSHCCELFKSRGWSVVSLDNRTKFELNRTGYNVNNARQYNVDFLKSIGVELIVADIRDNKSLVTAMRGCDYVINCAAQPAMTVSLDNPIYDAEVNIMGTVNILDIARIQHIPVALCSTIHVYGNGINNELIEKEDRYYRKTAAIKESHLKMTGSITALHVSKRASEYLARAFIESYGSEIFIARLTGIYAERQIGCSDHGWISLFAIQTILEKPITVYYSDKQVRDILYGQDAAMAFLKWFENGQPSGVYNICGGKPCIISIREYLKVLSVITGKKQDITITKEARKGDLWYFVGDYSKARKAFGWTPTVLPDEGLKKLVNWVKENKALFKQ